METSAVTTSASSIGIMKSAILINFSMVSTLYKLDVISKSAIGIPLSGMGCFYFLTFNYFCFMAILAHWRAAWANPGTVPVMKVSTLFNDDYLM
jgi:hypothetical protein